MAAPLTITGGRRRGTPWWIQTAAGAAGVLVGYAAVRVAELVASWWVA